MNSKETKKIYGLTESEAELFKEKLGRDPTEPEWAVCGALWSEHCSYKSTRVHLKRFHSSEPWVWQGPGENAGVVAITENIGVAFKMESHNHPSYIEPYEGAATGVGGILRDVFCMGAKPIAALNSLRFGSGAWNAHLLKRVTKGIADYGNAFGVPTVGGDTSFHEGYSENILVNAFAAGFVKKNEIFRGVVTNSDTKPKVLVYFGSTTGPDGVHGATMSSDEFGTESQSLKPTVQVGDPFAGKVLLEATLDLIKSGYAIGLQDMGAAGLTSSSVEMAERSNCGVILDLDKIPMRSKLTPTNLLLSESQERMLAAIAESDVPLVGALLEKHNIPHAIVGRVVPESKSFVCMHLGKTVVDIPISILVNEAPKYNWPLATKPPGNRASRPKSETSPKGALSITLTEDFSGQNELIESGISAESWLSQVHKDILPKILKHPNFANRRPIFTQYCSTVQGNTVAAPGTYLHASAAVVRLPECDPVAVAMASGCEERWVEQSPFEGAILSTLKIIKKIIAVGAKPLAMTDCLNFGSPQTSMGTFSQSVDGINAIAKQLRIPVVSGNVSLNNQTNGEPIPPTPMIGVVGKLDDCRNVPLLHADIKKGPLELYWVGATNPQYNISQLHWIFNGKYNGSVPSVDFNEEQKIWSEVQGHIREFKVPLCTPVGHGGVLISAILVALRSNGCIKFAPKFLELPAAKLLGEGCAGFLIGVRDTKTVPKFGQHVGTLSGLENNQGWNWRQWTSEWNLGLNPFI